MVMGEKGITKICSCMESGGFCALRKLSATVTVMHGFFGTVKCFLINTN